MTSQYQSPQHVFDVVIIGAGAAGLMCAAQTAKRGRKTLILDHAKKPGRKILISGGGRCNFTNLDVTASNYLCQNPHFVKSALSQYSHWDFISLVCQYQIDYEEREHGQLFCLSANEEDKNPAKHIVNMLLAECNSPFVEQWYRHHMQLPVKTGQGFEFDVTDEEGRLHKVLCQSLVVATGGLSMPKLGATPLGYQIAQAFGLSVVSTHAGLVPFTLHTQEKEWILQLSGIALDVEISTEAGIVFKEALLFTHRGLSGPVVLQISSYWQAGEAIVINLLPHLDVMACFEQEKQQSPSQLLKNMLAKYLPKRFVELYIQHVLLAQGVKDVPIKQLTHQQWSTLEQLLTQWHIKPNGTEGYRTAEVTLGGVDTKHLSSKTMQCNSVDGLYFIGEVMDVSGWLGGYNFQWAWSSGYVAGQYA